MMGLLKEGLGHWSRIKLKLLRRRESNSINCDGYMLLVTGIMVNSDKYFE